MFRFRLSVCVYSVFSEGFYTNDVFQDLLERFLPVASINQKGFYTLAPHFHVVLEVNHPVYTPEERVKARINYINLHDLVMEENVRETFCKIQKQIKRGDN